MDFRQLHPGGEQGFRYFFDALPLGPHRLLVAFHFLFQAFAVFFEVEQFGIDFLPVFFIFFDFLPLLLPVCFELFLELRGPSVFELVEFQFFVEAGQFHIRFMLPAFFPVNGFTALRVLIFEGRFFFLQEGHFFL